MTLKQIEAFYWAAKLGRFSIAAPRPYVTYETIVRRIVDLEESVGVQLFDRSCKPGRTHPDWLKAAAAGQQNA